MFLPFLYPFHLLLPRKKRRQTKKIRKQITLKKLYCETFAAETRFIRCAFQKKRPILIVFKKTKLIGIKCKDMLVNFGNISQYQ